MVVSMRMWAGVRKRNMLLTGYSRVGWGPPVCLGAGSGPGGQRLLPQCNTCSPAQGGATKAELARRQRTVFVRIRGMLPNRGR